LFFDSVKDGKPLFTTSHPLMYTMTESFKGEKGVDLKPPEEQYPMNYEYANLFLVVRAIGSPGESNLVFFYGRPGFGGL
jgi:hypothetical protein